MDPLRSRTHIESSRQTSFLRDTTYDALVSEAQRMLGFGADWLHMDIMIYIHAFTKYSVLNLNYYGSDFGLLDLGSGYMSIGWDVQDFAKALMLLSLCFFTIHNILCSHFVPNLTIGTPVIESLRKHTNAYLDCHLMVTNPLDYVDQFGKAGASGFTFHVEVSKDNWQELVKRIKSKGMRPGVALKPGTPVEEVFPLVEGENPVEMVLVMTVEPGFGGQKFMPDMMNKVRTLREKYPTLDIEVDGG
ncbi:ribulose-phosphate 3-epimerase, cytoplasmic isoform-like [Bidens hawaiensis]|uniref:ribulose-phosphate 3-epimerase, cytoplasmic isoform-like n=1 Tax=Bidens hawaiensis TaxID=980011 RepID=UPI00404A1722